MDNKFVKITQVGKSIHVSYEDDFYLFPICQITGVLVRKEKEYLMCTILTNGPGRTFKVASEELSSIYELFVKYLG